MKIQISISKESFEEFKTDQLRSGLRINRTPEGDADLVIERIDEYSYDLNSSEYDVDPNFQKDYIDIYREYASKLEKVKKVYLDLAEGIAKTCVLELEKFANEHKNTD